MRDKIRVLLVEDSERDASLLLRELKNGGYDVKSKRVETGDEMRTALESEEWDMILSDHNLPKFSSGEALELLHGLDLDIPFIIVSGCIGEEMAVAAMRAGAHDYIIKGEYARLVPAVERELREADVRLEKKLALEKSSRFSRIVENSLNEIYIFDAETFKFINVNRGARENLGYTMEELIRLTPPDLKPEYTQKNFAELIAPLVRGESEIISFNTVHKRKDSSFYPVEICLQLYLKEAPPVFVAIIQDITERKLADEALKKLYNAISQTVEAVVITNTEGTIEYVNLAFEKITGHTYKEAIGQNLRILKSGMHDDKFYKNLWDTAKSGKIWQGEIINKRKSGEFYTEEMTISPVMNESGNTTHFIAIKNDISDRKELEEKVKQRTEELAKERNNLERTVNIRTQELRDSLKKIGEAKLRLEHANRAKAIFLSSMSHELRTPLNGILGFVDLLQGQFFGKLNEKQVDYVKQIDESGRHLFSLINDLLDVAKIDAGAMDLELEDIKIEEWMKTSVAMVSSQLKKKNMTVEMAIDSSLGIVTIDIRKGKQILLNLLANAVKYTQDKGRIDIRAIKEASNVMVEVEDNGIGIEPDQLEKIFLEFHQADRVRDEQLGGTGIGLSLTRKLVELHRGRIGVESKLGEGSKFWFTLPLKQLTGKRDKSGEEKRNENHDDITVQRILVAEDNESNLSLILEMLSIRGHDVAVARNGLEAVPLAQSFRPNLIFMDIQMPVMDGLEACKRIRALPEISETPIIALTARTGKKEKDKHLLAGCNDHLPKPVQSRELFEMINRYL